MIGTTQFSAVTGFSLLYLSLSKWRFTSAEWCTSHFYSKGRTWCDWGPVALSHRVFPNVGSTDYKGGTKLREVVLWPNGPSTFSTCSYLNWKKKKRLLINIISPPANKEKHFSPRSENHYTVYSQITCLTYPTRLLHRPCDYVHESILNNISKLPSHVGKDSVLHKGEKPCGRSFKRGIKKYARLPMWALSTWKTRLQGIKGRGGGGQLISPLG